MKREQNWRMWETAGMLVTLLLGNGLHFLYDWTGQAGWAAYISAVNESTWEHMKLLAVPWILWTAVTCIVRRGLDRVAAGPAPVRRSHQRHVGHSRRGIGKKDRIGGLFSCRDLE